MTKKKFAVVVDRATAEQLNGVHKIIKEHANGWWHRFTNLWVVGSEEDADFWCDQLAKSLNDGDASVIVFQLPSSKDERDWQYFGIAVEQRTAWFFNNYDNP